MKTQIKALAASIGITEIGFTTYGGKTAVVCLFPYFTGAGGGNLSVYTYGKDYHLIIKNKLQHLAALVGLGDCTFHADIGESVDRMLAHGAGLGYYGENRMLYNDKFGSYFFIGYLLTAQPIEPDAPVDKTCLRCGLCIKACPGNALEGGRFYPERCASHISQKKGELTEGERQILKKSGCAFGCDACQTVCPLNNIEPVPMAEFTQDLKPSLTLEELNLSNKAFQRQFGDRAFAWRGKAVLIRNLKILNEE